MKRFFSRITIPSLLLVSTLGTGLYFLFWKFQLGLIRYVDLDEFAYLWWASHVHQGVMPYRDFFYYSTPGFLWFLSPVFVFFSGIAPLLVGRVMMELVFTALAMSLGVLFWQLRRSWLAVAVPLLLIFLPLPADKFLEIRPDTLSLLCAVLGMICLIHVMNGGMHKRNTRFSNSFFVGLAAFWSALSLVILQKTLPMIGISWLCFLGWIVQSIKTTLVTKDGYQQFFFAAVIGSGVVIIPTGVWLVFHIGTLHLIWYSLVRLPMEINVLGKIFIITPTQFFFPNDVFYGTFESTLGYVLNLLLWCAGILIGVIRLIVPSVPNGKKGLWQEVMVAGVFLLSLLLYKYFFPMKHAQYLMPAALFVAWYVADGLFLLWISVKHHRVGNRIYGVMWFVFIYVLVQGYWSVNAPKFLWRNDRELQTIETILHAIPQSEPVLDLVGLTMYYPSPYYLSCLPIGEFTPLMSLTLPPLSTRLQETNTKFIYQGKSKRVYSLSREDQAYITSHFVSALDDSLFIRSDVARLYVKIISK